MNNKKSFKDMTLKERFDSKGFAISAYSKAFDLERTALTRVLSRELTGKNKTNRSGEVRRIIARLKADKVWIEPLPEEK